MADTPRPGRLARVILRAPVLLYRCHLRFLLGSRFLLVSHVGRRSRRRYRTVVEVIGHQETRWYVMSGFGRNADWYLNVLAAGHADICVAGRACSVNVHELDPAAAAAIVASYERRNRLIAGVVRRALSRQVGWRYTGSDHDRRRLVDQLPVLAFDAQQPHS